MKKFEEYLTDENIIFYLCRIRAKLAKQRNKKHLVHLLSLSNETNYHLNKRGKKNSYGDFEIEDLLPRRRKWKKIGQKERNKNGQTINSIDKNILSLKKTVYYDLKYNPNEPYIKRLHLFLNKVKDNCYDPKYSFQKPRIYPKEKEEIRKGKENICRPISTYALIDKIIICITNKYFTNLFDDFFYNDSYAFRAKRKINSNLISLSHHDAFQRIINFREKYNHDKLFVAECDMMKFYDTVNHTVIKKRFKKLLRKARIQYSNAISKHAVRLFYKYLDSYTFNKDVYPLNDSPDYFKNYNIINGKFGWVEKQLKRSGYYRRINNAKIGVPQGGALSGLIANMVLDYSDKCVVKKNDNDLLYIRFCDDIIIMHKEYIKCLNAYKNYESSLKKLKIIPHVPERNKKLVYNKNFWKTKSKEPYIWGPKGSGFIPWIGFVGYEINIKGEIRVRKSSLEKEIKKQYDLIEEVRKAVLNDKNRVSCGRIEESVINRLIGMSVGRVKLWNYQNIENDMCWVRGFVLLNDNKYLREQLRLLDKMRNTFIKKLHDEISGLESKNGCIDEDKNYQNIFYGKPFSYYYHVIEKNAT